MARLTEDQKAMAYRLWREGVLKKDIAKYFSVAAKTVTELADKEGWQNRAEKEEAFEGTTADQLRNLIAHQLHVLELIAKKKAETIDEHTSIKELEGALLEKGAADSLNKLYVNIRGHELSHDAEIKAVTGFLKHLGNHIPNVTEVWQYARNYLEGRRK